MMRDIFAFGGLAMAGVGLWILEPWVSLTVVGFLLFGMGILPAIKK